MRRPKSSLQAVTLFNQKNEDGDWIPVRYELQSWITLQSGKWCSHAKDSSQYEQDSTDGAWKAQIQRFKMKAGSTDSVSQILVRHAYQFRELDLDPSLGASTEACNYLYLSPYEDWVDPKSITGVIWVLHANIGEALRGRRSHRELMESNIFFYNAMFVPKIGEDLYGHLKALPLPDFNDPQWPLPDMATSEGFRNHMFEDIFKSMKASTGSRDNHLQWFIPIHVMVDLFAVSSNIHRTPTFFVFKNPSSKLLDSLLDKGWDEKLHVGADIIKCKVNQQSIIFRYYISRQTLYMRFQFNRERMLPDKSWVPIDQCEAIEMIFITCKMGEWQQQVQVGRKWSIADLREEIKIVLGHDGPKRFWLYIIQDQGQALQINERSEKQTLVEKFFPPNKVQIVPHDLEISQ